ncbi:MAG: DEAD/DEAH box helicase [Acidimicrobiales bacterium]
MSSAAATIEAPPGDLGVTFLPGDPARLGSLAVYRRRGKGAGEGRRDGGWQDEVALVLPTATGKNVRRSRVSAQLAGMGEAIGVLRELDPAIPGATAWSAAFDAGLAVIAKGRLYPAVTAGGWDSWRVGPLDPADRRYLAELAASFPAAAHPVELEGASPLRLRSAEALILAAWDALADTLTRTAAAPVLSSQAFAGAEPVRVDHLAGWLVEASSGLAGAQGTDVALRVELAAVSSEPAPPLDQPPARRTRRRTPAGSGAEPEQLPAGRAVLQLSSRIDPSLIVDAADLFSSPAAVVSMFGEDAEADLLRALRRGSRAWLPIGQLLKERAPSGLDLDDDSLAELLSDGSNRLAEAGIEVLWPAGILAEGLKMQASLAAVGVVSKAGFSLDAMVDFSWRATLNGELLSPEEIDQLAEAKRSLVRLRGRWVAVDAEFLRRLQTARSRRLTMAEALGTLLAGTADLDGEPVEVVADDALCGLLDRITSLTGSNVGDLPLPAGLGAGVELRPYQLRGISWLHAMTSAGLGGCLADDMGLGKTLQVIALHLHRVAEGLGPTLVVCPTSLLGNWEREVQRFAPGTPVRRHHGPARALDEIGRDEITVTSYGVARMDAAALAAAGFGLVVADEAQHAKNPLTASARALRTIGGGARLALTGTPVENRLSELWSILDWTTPGLLGPLERFTRNVAGPIERQRDPVAMQRLSRTIGPFLLRRRKTDPGVAPDLPERVVTDIPVPLTREQTTLYEAEVREALAAIKGERKGIARQALVLKLLTALKQICNHPAQYLRQTGPLAGRSGKLAALEELVDVIVSEGESVLVFSQFVQCLTLVESRLAQLGLPVLVIHGGVPARRRTEIVDAFQSGERQVMLLSLKAGGVGLNLTRATHVVHYDRWWNPAVEDQATDRAHRIGQQRTVQVHRLIAEGTLEDRIASLIEAKRDLAESVVGGGESWIGKLSNAELAELVTLGSQS